MNNWKTNKDSGGHFQQDNKPHLNSPTEPTINSDQTQSSKIQPSNTISNFEIKQQQKLEHAKKMADKHRQSQKEEHEHHKKMSDMIPFGQPILVGHHSEGMHRSHIKKMDNSMRRAIEHGEKAEHFENRVKNIENPNKISSDDPEAVVKLKKEIEELELERAKWKASKPNPDADHFDNDSPAMRRMHLESISTKIRSRQKRIVQLNSIKNVEEKTDTKNGVTLKIDQTDNRVKLFFPGVPDVETRTKLKRNGFRWSPRNKAWQRMINNQSIFLAEQFQENNKQ